MDDSELTKILIMSKVEERINKMNKIIIKLAGASVMLAQDSDLLNSHAEYINTKK